MKDGFSVDIDKVSFLVLVYIYKDMVDTVKVFENAGYVGYGSVDYFESYFELSGFERALRLVGMDPDMLKGVDTSL